MNMHCTCDKPKLITNSSYTHATNENRAVCYALGTMEAFSSCVSLMESKHRRSGSLSSTNKQIRVWKVFPAGPTPGITVHNLVLDSSEIELVYSGSQVTFAGWNCSHRAIPAAKFLLINGFAPRALFEQFADEFQISKAFSVNFSLVERSNYLLWNCNLLL